MVYDPDVIRQKSITDVLHWLVFNIPGTARELPENVPAEAHLSDGTTQARNDKGLPGFLGPGAGAQGPPHHYTFLLFALDIKLALGPDATRADVQSAMDGHILAKAVLIGRYQRAVAPN
jgi:Raf kinase inhibitor-like YbhB/YbcL family protein